MLHPELTHLIRDVPDFPKPGILFKDFTPLLADPKGLALAVELMANPYRGTGVNLVAGAESRGFIFGTALAQTLSAGFIPIRKKGKLPSATKGITYSLEYGSDRLEIHADAIRRGQRVLIGDDLLATGGTLEACCHLVADAGAQIHGVTVLIEIAALKGRAKLNKWADVHAVMEY